MVSQERLPKQVYLKYGEQHRVTFSEYWKNQIEDALTTILRKSGAASAFILGVQNLGGGIHTFYDNLAMELEKSAKVFPNDEHVKGLLAHMLVFAGKTAYITIKLTARFIRWVFEQVLAVLNRAVRYAVAGVR